MPISPKYIQNEVFHNLEQLRKLKTFIAMRPIIFGYESKAVLEAVRARLKSKPPAYDPEYMPDFTQYQYDLEIYIFLNYEELYQRELEIQSGDRLAAVEMTRSATLMPREHHLKQAMLIRWPEKILPNGSAVTGLAVTPWVEDYVYGLCNYKNVVSFGGGGQGKTFTPLAFALIMWEHFVFTKGGAAATFSTVSERKLERSIWSHLNKLASYKNAYQYSLMAGSAVKAADYAFVRKDTRGKRIEEGGTMQGMLLVRGSVDSTQIDKLTGQHDVVCRIYLLDEGQSTGPAPMSAYNNMFIHPKYGWFMMAGNYAEDTDLLGVNCEPVNGWDSVDEFTHMWEGRLKSPESDLGHKSLVIHYNNNLSPAIPPPNATKEQIDKALEYERKYSAFLPTMEKKKKLYETKEQEEQIASKRFWIGFRYQSEKQENDPLITVDLLHDSKSDQEPTVRKVGQFMTLDTASQVDRTIATIIQYGMDEQGMIQFWPSKIYPIRRPTTQFKINEETAQAIFEVATLENIPSGEGIMDWTGRTGILECLVTNHNFRLYPLIYQGKPPDGTENEVTKRVEHKIEVEVLEVVDRDGTTRRNRHYAHEKFANRITFGAWALREFIEKGCMKGFNKNLLSMFPENKGFEKEFCLRYLRVVEKGPKRGRLSLDDKQEICRKYKFSPDVLDTFLQAGYFLTACKGIIPGVPGLGKLSMLNNKQEKKVDNSKWNARMRFK